MARVKHKAGAFVMVRKDLLCDSTWRNLSSSAKVIYIYMRANFHPKNDGEVMLTYSSMADMFSSSTVSRALKELISKGFVEKTTYGGLYGGACKYRFIGNFKDFFVKGYRIS